jgi:hypothetical protein
MNRAALARTMGALGVGAIVLSGCGGSTEAAAPGASPAAAPVCAPMNQYLVAARLLGQQLTGQDKRPPLYLQHVVDSGISALQQIKTTGSGTTPTDADTTLQYWTSLRITLAGDGFDVAKVTKEQDVALGNRGRILGSADAGDRIVSYASTTCGPGVEPTAQQLAAFS